ncbi:MAG TPA: M23 family metallopeptidase [Kofleriaceae bacterium]|nr:M23 family metallopeptidase [Kofleriaceae bacterium]
MRSSTNRALVQSGWRFGTRTQYVRAGDTIGYVGAPEPGAFKQLHFELWERDLDRHFVPVDPRAHLASWTLLEHSDAFTPAPSKARSEAA